MSGISEIDIKDFERIDVKEIRKVINDAEVSPDLFYLLNEWCSIIEGIQHKLSPQVAALFKPTENVYE